ncbi:MAG TPA: redoxin domain-containing protein [Pirellulaceae bacterium]|nr:redoxin domain-containing protein [Pirellulaceae bacterium]HMP69404.1 redoxin domain-containing protein [Pirellulaceae bacterium]
MSANLQDRGAVNANPQGSNKIEFSLKDYRGQLYRSSDFETSVIVVVFMGTECPIAKLYASKLQKMQDDFAGQVQFFLISSNQQDSLVKLGHFVRSHQLSIPFLKDPGNLVADKFGAQRTPEAFVLDSRREIVYQGRIDDQYSYGVQRAQADYHYLFDAVNAVLSHTEIKIKSTEVHGCIIGRILPAKTGGAVTFANQISRLLNQHCVTCHREGEIGPFCLTDYAEVAGWAGMIAEVVSSNRMPPWHANPDHGEFANDARLSDEEKAMIIEWVEAGAPLGDVEQLPTIPEFSEGWRIGEPDLVVRMSERPFEVPATGSVPYQYFEVDPGFTEDKWVRAAECRPGAREVVHHIIVGIRGEGEFGRRRRGVHDDLDSEWLSATAPGAPPLQLADGYAKLVPAGSRLIFQMHYTPNGTRQSDLSEIGLIFADPQSVKKRVLTQQLHNARFEIPAGDPHYEVQASTRIERDAELLALFPHMHFRGKAFKYLLQLPGVESEILLDVPRYDFNWQNSYVLKQHRFLRAGSEIKGIAIFDNSSGNLANPDPSKPVRWGDQTWEEMMIGYFDLAIDIAESK